MSLALNIRATPRAIAWLLLVGAFIWYASFWAFLNSGGNFLSHVAWPWLLVLTFVPVINGALALAMHRALRESGRGIRLSEIIIVMLVTPHFLAAAYVWWGLFYYM